MSSLKTTSYATREKEIDRMCELACWIAGINNLQFQLRAGSLPRDYRWSE
jgi:hypothetical protein